MRIILFFILISTMQLFSKDALVWQPGGKAQSSAAAIETALSQNSVSVQNRTDISGVDLGSFDYVFICLGVYPDNYTLDEGTDGDEIDRLVDYLDNGGRIYMEGGDAWARDAQTELQRRFHIHGEADGDGDLSEIYGAGCFDGRLFSYNGGNNYIDHLAPLEGATVFFSNSAPAYACGVGYENGTWRSLGLSFEFGGLQDGGDTKNDLMADILIFLDAGCLRRKPAPMSLVAYSGYDNRAPLVWDAPPGQSSLAKIEKNAPNLILDVSEGKKEKTKNRTLVRTDENKVAFYQAASYNVYRSESENGPFTKIASNIKRQYYCDDTADNGTTWHYVVTAVYDADESEFSNVASATPKADGYTLRSPWVENSPSLDGVIEESEWAWSVQKSVANEGHSVSSTLYIMNDDNYLYLAIDDKANSGLVDDDQIGVYFDDDLNYQWPSSSLSEEGNFWCSRSGSQNDDFFRALAGHWPVDMQWADPQSTNGVSSASSVSAGRVQVEMRIDLRNGPLNASPGETIGLFLYALDMPDSLFTVAWPSVVMNTSWEDAWLIPELFGEVVIGRQSDCQVFSDAEDVSGVGLYHFNEDQDGRQVDMDVSALDGRGDFIVAQNNCLYENLPGADALPLFWTLETDDIVSTFTADVTFHYTDADASGFTETDAFFGVAWFNEQANAWIWKGGEVDAGANTVVVRDVSETGVYVLFRRIFGDSNGDGYVDEADLQQFADVWLSTNPGEFDDGSVERFHNYNKNTNDKGEQVVDEGDLQVFSDNWLHGTPP